MNKSEVLHLGTQNANTIRRQTNYFSDNGGHLVNQEKNKKRTVKGSKRETLPEDLIERCEEKKDPENEKRVVSAEENGSESSYLRRA